MVRMAEVKCPLCGLLGEVGTFCENCGPAAGRLCEPEPVAVPAPAPAPVPDVAQRACPQPAAPPAGAPSGFNPAAPANLPPLRPLDPIAPFGGMTGYPPFGASVAPPVEIPDGMPFGATVTFPETMWKGWSSPVKIVFQAVEDLYADVTVALFNGPNEVQRHPLGYRPTTERLTFPLNVCPKVAGTVELTVRFFCVRDGMDDPDVFSAVFPVRVLDHASPNSITIDTKVEVNGAGASLLQYHSPAVSGINLRDPRVEQSRAVTHQLAVDLEGGAPRLTLTGAGKMIQLWALGSDETMVCGRHDTCDYVVRVFDRECHQMDKSRSMCLSRRHFRLTVSDGRRLRIFDGMEGEPSTWGVQVEGNEVGPGGMVIPRGVSHLTFGAKAPNYPEGVVGFTLELFICDDGLISGFTLVRDDGLDEQVVAIVSRKVPCGGCDWVWNGKCFLVSGRKIVPGMSVEVAGVPYRAGRYHQRKE